MAVKQIYKSAWDIDGQYILKRGGDRAVLEKSMRLSALLAARGIPVPEYIGGIVPSDGAYFVLMKKMPGQSFDPYKGNPYENGVMLGRLVAQLHAALREIPDDFDCPDADCMRDLDEYIVPEVPVSKDVLEYCRAFGPLYEALPRQLIHRDVHTSNMLFEHGVFTGWLDFDISQKNVRLFDICYLAGSQLVGNYRKPWRLRMWREIFRGVLQGYDEISPLTAQEREAVPHMFVHIEVLFAAFFSKNGQEKTSKNCLNMAKWLYRHRGILTP